MQIDWVFKHKGKWYIVEVKNKELYGPPPFFGQGLDIKQVETRLEFQKDTGIRCVFLIFTPDNKIYWNYLDELEKTEYFDTKKKIRIYNIENFHTAV
jgi:hypothetical protein